MKLEGAAGRDPIRLYSKLESLFSKILLSRRYSTTYRGTGVSTQKYPYVENTLKRGREEGRKSEREMKKEIINRFRRDPPSPTDTMRSSPN